MYTCGVWTAKEGREDEFARRWQQSADRMALDNPDLTFRLYRDRDDPRRFLSLGEGWRTRNDIETARESPHFQDAMASIWRMVDAGEMSTLDLVVAIG